MFKQKNNALSIYAVLFCAFLSLLYFFPSKIKWISVLFVGFMLVYQVKEKRKFLVSIPMIVWIAYVVLGTIIAWIRGISEFGDIVEFGSAIVIGLLVYSLRTTKKEQRDMLSYLCILYIIVIVGCLLQIITPNLLRWFNQWHLTPSQYGLFKVFMWNGSLVGFSFQTAITAFYLSLLIGFLFSYALNVKDKKGQAILGVGCVIAYILLFFTSKRIFILLTVVNLVILLCMHYKEKILPILVISGIAFAIMLLVLLSTEAGQKIIERTLSNPLTSRGELYEVMINRFLEHPILGNGNASGLELITEKRNGHNIYLQILCENGIVGFGMVMFIFGYHLIHNLRLLKDAIAQKRGTLVLSMCLFIQMLFLGWGITGNPFYDVYPLVVYMAATGIIQNKVNTEKRIVGGWRFNG